MAKDALGVAGLHGEEETRTANEGDIEDKSWPRLYERGEGRGKGERWGILI